jgi:toxin-antitoxin system PIN domain toxin
VITYLLDINLLIALCDPMHVSHEIAHRWFASKGKQSWATCPITENGFVRVVSHPNYPNRPGETNAILDILRQMCEATEHQFWNDDISLRDLITIDRVITHAQITEVYLLGLAVKRGSKFATLDQRIPVSIIPGGKESLESAWQY